MEQKLAIYRYSNVELVNLIEKYSQYTDFVGYKRSGMPFQVLSYAPVDGSISKKYFKWREILIHILEMPLRDIPLYVNSKEPWASFFSKWRLERGK
jgi:hypothetical protein